MTVTSSVPPSSAAPAPSAPRADVRPLLPLWAAVIAAAASGALLTLAFPALSVWVAAFPAVGLLLTALIGRRTWSSLLVGFAFGATFFLILVGWTGRYLGPIPWLALGIFEGVLTAVGLVPLTLAYRWIPRVVRSGYARSLVVAAVVAALWIGRELFVGNWPYGGFPWARIGYALSETPPARVTSWVGISGLGFLMILLVALLVELLRSGRSFRPVVAIAPVALVAVLAFLPAFPTTPVGTMRIGAVQGNGPTGYFDTREPLAVIGAQMQATAPLYGEKMDLLVWPEGSLDGDPFRSSTLAQGLDRVTARVGAPLLANAATAKGERFYNTSFLWPEDAPAALGRDDVQTHAKRHPVPFGEYVPNREFFNALVPDLIGLIGREYTPGDDAPVMKVGERTIGLAICFDVIYDDVIREGIGGGAEVLVFQTNNADFRGTVENLQQLGIARMRAIETGRSVVNISTVGTSQIIRPDGSTVATLNEDRPGAMLEDVELRTGATAGVVIGPGLEQGLLWGGLLVLVGAGVLSRLRRRTRRG